MSNKKFDEWAFDQTVKKGGTIFGCKDKSGVNVGFVNTGTGEYFSLSDEWISVVDNPPEKEEEYLIWPHGKYCGPTAMFWPFADHGGHVKNTFEIESEYGDITQIDVTHYQELPGGP